jgi:hypothetical protein
MKGKGREGKLLGMLLAG